MPRLTTILTVFLTLCSFLVPTASIADSTNKEIVSQNTRQLTGEEMYGLLAAEMALQRGYYNIGLTEYLRLAKKTKHVEIVKEATMLSMSLADIETSLVPAERWAKMAPEDKQAQLTSAALWIRAAQPALAKHYLESVAMLEKEKAAQTFVILYQQLNQPQDKLATINSLEMMSSDLTPQGRYALAEIFTKQKLYELANKHLEAIAKHSHSAQANRLKATILLETNEVDKGLALLNTSLEQAPSIDSEVYYIEKLMTYERFEAAHKRLLSINTAELSPEYLLTMARLSMEGDWYPDAKRFLQLTRTFPDHADTAHYFLGRISEIQTEVDAAVKWYDSVESGPFHMTSHIKAAWLLVDDAKHHDALTLLDGAQPTTKHELNKLAQTKIDILIEMEAFDRALPLVSKQLQHSPSDLGLRVTRGYIAEQLDLIDIVEEDLQFIITQQPDNAHALNALGFILLEKTNRYDEAEVYIAKALALQPNEAAFLDSMGWLRYKQGRHDEAVTLLRKALSAQSTPEIAAHLGEVLWVTGQSVAAQQIWQGAHQVDPNHPLLRETMNRFEYKP